MNPDDRRKDLSTNNNRATKAIDAMSIIGILLAAAAAALLSGFSSIIGSETAIAQQQQQNMTGTNATTTTAAQQQPPIYIIKDGTNSYTISGSSSSVGSFDTTYRIAGERSSIRSAENLIISTITDDFRMSPTIGYVMVGNTTTTTAASATGNATTATLPNPFASPEQITERVTNELRRVIAEAESGTSQGQHVEIKCDFGMSLEDMRCHYSPLP
jgi:hypothetical protein